MKLIIVIIALALERYVGIGAMLGRSCVLSGCFTTLKSTLSKTGLWKGMIGVAAIVLPLPILIGVVEHYLGGLFGGLLGVLVGLAALLYSLGPKVFYKPFETYIKSSEAKDAEKATAAAEKVLGSAPTGDEAAKSRAVTLAVNERFLNDIFAPVLWFGLLGPFGALLFRMSAELNKKTPSKEGDYAAFVAPAAKLHSFLEWIPLRFLGLTTALAGDMKNSMNYWLELFLEGVSRNQELLKNYFLNALSTSDEKAKDANLDENKKALELLDKSMFVLIAIVAVFAAFSFIF